MFHWTEIDVARFLQKIFVDENGCWIWLGAKSRGSGNKHWYGTFWVKGKAIRAHKFSAVTMGCGYKEGDHLDHDPCNVSLCVNPCHIKCVPPLVNMLRRWQGRRKQDIGYHEQTGPIETRCVTDGSVL